MLVRGLGVASTWITLIAVMSLLVYHGFGVAGTRYLGSHGKAPGVASRASGVAAVVVVHSDLARLFRYSSGPFRELAEISSKPAPLIAPRSPVALPMYCKL